MNDPYPILDQLPPCWRSALNDEFRLPYFQELMKFVRRQRAEHVVLPPEKDVFSAFRLTPLAEVRVVILGQDPYHDEDQAHGLSFSVRHGVKLPPSLRNIYKELESDLEMTAPSHGCLTSWAKQGVLLLNTVLTVRLHEANSHRKNGWEQFTDAVLKCVNDRPSVAFVLWGRQAQKKADLIHDRHLVIRSAHPSPLSASRGFFGSRPFSRVNDFLKRREQREIDWRPQENPVG